MYEWLSDRVPFCFFPQSFSPSLKAVDRDVDVEKYMGVWHEQVRKPMRGQNGCAESKATYSYDKENKKVIVMNECIDKERGNRSIKGFAEAQNERNNMLKVRFNKWIVGNYWILDIDDNYEYAVVGEPCRKFAWVLSRKENPDVEEIKKRIGFLQNKGYDVSDVILRGESDNRGV